MSIAATTASSYRKGHPCAFWSYLIWSIPPPKDVSTAPVRGSEYWRTEYDVLEALATLGHQTKILGGLSELTDVRECLQDWKPKVVFNLMEEFRGEGIYMPYVLGYLQLKRVAFTGCNPAGLLLADNKALAKKILRYHRIPVPDFTVFPRGRRVHRHPST